MNSYYFDEIAKETRGERRIVQIGVNALSELLDYSLCSRIFCDKICESVITQIRQQQKEEEDAASNQEVE